MQALSTGNARAGISSAALSCHSCIIRVIYEAGSKARNPASTLDLKLRLWTDPLCFLCHLLSALTKKGLQSNHVLFVLSEPVIISCHHCRTNQLYTDAKALARMTTSTQFWSTHLTCEKGKNLSVSHLLETPRARCDSCVRVIWSWGNSRRFKNHLPFCPNLRCILVGVVF